MNQTYLDTAAPAGPGRAARFCGRHVCLKGGTAINLFIRDMPRLSDDLDLVFPDYRFRVNAAWLAGKPDVVFTKIRLVVFIDGDFLARLEVRALVGQACPLLA